MINFPPVLGILPVRLLGRTPPGASKTKDTRDLGIHADGQLDEAQAAACRTQARRLPGEHL